VTSMLSEQRETHRDKMCEIIAKRRQEKAVIETVFYALYSVAQCSCSAFLLIKSFV
jgi:hypothetical protein